MYVVMLLVHNVHVVLHHPMKSTKMLNAIYTMEPLNNGHIGGRDLVLCREVVPTRRSTSKPHPSIPNLNLLRGVDRISDFMQTRLESRRDEVGVLVLW